MARIFTVFLYYLLAPNQQNFYRLYSTTKYAKFAVSLCLGDGMITGSANMVMDKKLMKRIEDIEALPAEDKGKVYYFIDMAITHNKIKKAFAK
jgi:hypothetical protein